MARQDNSNEPQTSEQQKQKDQLEEAARESRQNVPDSIQKPIGKGRGAEGKKAEYWRNPPVDAD